MDEMTLLTSMRDEVPLAQPSPAAERRFRAGLTEIDHSERVRPIRPRHRFLSGADGPHGHLRWWKLAVPGVAAAGLAAALVVMFIPQRAGTPAGPAADGPPSGVPISAHLLADIASKKVLSQQPVKPDQWVYQKIESYDPPITGGNTRPAKPVHISTQWVMADGANAQWGPVDGHMIGGLVLTGPNAAADEKILAEAAAAYANLDTLPKDPAALEAYFESKARYAPPAPGLKARNKTPRPGATPTVRFKLGKPNPSTGPAPAAFKAEQAYVVMQNMLSSEILPPSLTAELYQAIADVPGVIAKTDVKDVSGQTGVEFILPQSPYNVNLGTILSATTYQYLGQASWYGHPPYVWEKNGQASGSYHEEVLLDQALVSGPGIRP